MAPKGAWAQGPPTPLWRQGSEGTKATPKLEKAVAPSPKLAGAWAARHARNTPAAVSQRPEASACTPKESLKGAGKSSRDDRIATLPDAITLGKAAENWEDAADKSPLAVPKPLEVDVAPVADAGTCTEATREEEDEVLVKTLSAGSTGGRSSTSSRRRSGKARGGGIHLAQASTGAAACDAPAAPAPVPDWRSEPTLFPSPSVQTERRTGLKSSAAQSSVRGAKARVHEVTAPPEVTGPMAVVVAEVAPWLGEMRMQHLQEPILEWCDVMGACSLDEVLGCLDELLASLGLNKSEAQRFRSKASSALARSRAGSAAEAQVATSHSSRSLGEVLKETSTSSLQDGGRMLFMRERQGQKKTQKKDKKERLQRHKAAAEGEASFGDGLPRRQTSEDLAVLAEAAKEKLEQQLRQEEERRKTAAIDALTAAMAGSCMEQLVKAIEDMEAVDLQSHELVPQGKQALERLQRRHQQRCEEAVCALQAAVEAPRNDCFGSLVREALESADDACQAQGGKRVCQEAQHALRSWDEVRMALHISLRSRCADAMQLSVLEAKEANLSLSMIGEAEKLLQELEGSKGKS